MSAINKVDQKEKLYASQEKIEWLLFKSQVEAKAIIKETGVSKSAFHALKRGESSIENMRFNHAAAMTKYADKLIDEISKIKE